MKSSLSSSSIACYIHTLAPIWFHTICMDNMRYYTSDRTNVKCCVFVYRLPAYKLNIKPKCIYRSGIEWGTPCSKHKYRCCIENEIILYPFAVVQHLQFLFRIHNHVQTFIRQTGTEFIIRTIWPIVCVCERERIVHVSFWLVHMQRMTNESQWENTSDISSAILKLLIDGIFLSILHRCHSHIMGYAEKPVEFGDIVARGVLPRNAFLVFFSMRFLLFSLFAIFSHVAQRVKNWNFRQRVNISIERHRF